MSGRIKRPLTDRIGTSRDATQAPATPSSDVLRKLVTLYQQNRHHDLLAVAAQQQMRHPQSLILYSLIAGAHAGLGNSRAAIGCLDKALKLWPHSAELYYNKGVILGGIGAHDAAKICYLDALRIDPSHAGATNNLGSVLKEKGDFAAAIHAYRKAAALQPKNAAVHNNLGIAHQQIGQLPEALDSFITSLQLSPDNASVRRNLVTLLSAYRPTRAVPSLTTHLLDIMTRDQNVRPSDLAPAICGLCHTDPNLKRASAALDSGTDARAALDALAGLPLLTTTMELCPIPDPTIEQILTRLRATMCLAPYSTTDTTRRVSVLVALAMQCFVNEYIYEVTPEEQRALTERTDQVRAHLSCGTDPRMADLLCLASYAPLSQYDFAAKLTADNLPEKIWKIQIAAPAQEAKLRARLPAFGQITDTVSDKVRSQYEDSPYPRWMRPGCGETGLSLAQVVDQLNLQLRNFAPRTVTAPSILVAGCGTGQQSIEIAQRFAGAQVTAIDLSRASLAYASRKTIELGITNIEYLHGDLLNLDALGCKFDIVISTGVLHHMADPEKGWRALCHCLRPHGLMKIALYSERAREDIVRLRREISETGISAEPQAMRDFRARLLRDSDARASALTRSSDFYSMSAFRDLLFHVQEHRFTIPMIATTLDRLGLAFCGFEMSNYRFFSAFRAHHPDLTALIDLDLWNTFETEHPMTFSGMYQFWCQKL